MGSDKAYLRFIHTGLTYALQILITLKLSVMARYQSQIVGLSALNHILQHGAQMAKDNKTIKNHLLNYSNREGNCITNNLVVQTGAQLRGQPELLNYQALPANIRKDHHCCNSLNISPKKQDQVLKLQLNKFGLSSRETASQRSPRHSRNSRRSQIIVNKKLSSRSKQQGQNKFICLAGLIQSPSNGRKTTQAIKNQQKYIEKLRQQIQHKHQKKVQQQEKAKKQEQKELQRISSLKNRFHRHMSRKTNNITFDIDGNFIFVEPENNEKALRRKYPPASVNYSLQKLEQPSTQNHHIHIKQKAAKGQAFASAILKTMNMSKFSLNMTTKTCNIDQFAFMKRNDLFNNNHCRQVTTIPYLQVCEGANYTETHTNLSVSNKKSQRTAHSENKGKFKTHSLLDNYKENSEAHNKTEFIEQIKKSEEIEKRRIQSSKPYMRPKTSLPKSARTSDRIVSVNQNLVVQLIE